MAEDRTEKPTSRRLRDARRKGQIARSRDVEQAAQLVAVLGVFAWAGRSYVEGLGSAVRAGLERMGQPPARGLDMGELTTLAAQGAATIATLVGPLALAAAAGGVLAATLQGGWNLAPEALTPDWTRLSPSHGLKRLAPSRIGPDLLKMLVALSVISWISVRVVLATLDVSVSLGRMSPAHVAVVGWGQAERLLRQAAIGLGVVAAADYLLQRWRVDKALRMTKNELRDDLRLIEGNPEVKARVRRIQRDMARRRMLADVPKATVVVTNPTHFAVALLYERSRMSAPRVIAKGRDLLAQRIREIASQHGVPVVENVPLAQALYAGVEVGESIPADLFGAVAEVLAYLIRLKQLVL
jgi:flagellar biosynthetic protein FlhB